MALHRPGLLIWAAASKPRSASKTSPPVQGVRANQLVGYGLVVGLNGTGDSLRNSPFTEQSLQSMLDSDGRQRRAGELAHEKHRRRAGDRGSAALFGQGLAHRRHGLVARRRHVARRRLAGDDAALGRRRRDLCGGAGAGRDRRFPGAGEGGVAQPERADDGPHPQRRAGRARGQRPARRRGGARARAAQPGFQHGGEDRRRRSTPTRRKRYGRRTARERDLRTVTLTRRPTSARRGFWPRSASFHRDPMHRHAS